MPRSVSSEQLHRYVISTRNQTDCCLAALGYLEEPATISDVRDALVAAGRYEAKGWNFARALRKARPKTVLVDRRWALSPSGKDWVSDNDCFGSPSTTAEAQSALRSLLPKIADGETREFVDEAISCLENGLKRSAVVMSWLATVHILKVYTFNHRRADFDAEAKRVDAKWRTVRSLDDYTRLKESDFLDRLASISVVGKSVKAELVECLRRRNACGHPNSYKLGDTTVAHHLETLMLNVFYKFV